MPIHTLNGSSASSSSGPVREIGRSAELNAVLRAHSVATSQSSQVRARVAVPEYAIVKFYSPTCGPCQKIAPAYQRLAEAYVLDNGQKRSNPKAAFFQVNTTSVSDVAGAYGVSLIPTFALFKSGVHKENMQISSEQALRDWAVSKVGPIPTSSSSSSSSSTRRGYSLATGQPVSPRSSSSSAGTQPSLFEAIVSPVISFFNFLVGLVTPTSLPANSFGTIAQFVILYFVTLFSTNVLAAARESRFGRMDTRTARVRVVKRS